MHRVLDFWNLLEVAQLKSFDLEGGKKREEIINKNVYSFPCRSVDKNDYQVWAEGKEEEVSYKRNLLLLFIFNLLKSRPKISPSAVK